MHVTDRMIELFVIGELPAEWLAAFETHISMCEHCAKKLADEARFEVAMSEIAAAKP